MQHEEEEELVALEPLPRFVELWLSLSLLRASRARLLISLHYVYQILLALKTPHFLPSFSSSHGTSSSRFISMSLPAPCSLPTWGLTRIVPLASSPGETWTA